MIFQEVKRIKREHLDDSSAIVKNRVKGSLNVTRAFGAGFLKQVSQVLKGKMYSQKQLRNIGFLTLPVFK